MLFGYISYLRHQTYLVMMFDRDLYKTKLCHLYQRGHCPRQSCSFAHGDAELRRYSGSANGRHQHRHGDLRNKLDRRCSPRRRSSPGKDVRGQQAYAVERSSPQDRGYSLSMSPPRDREREKRQRVDWHPSDVSDDIKKSSCDSDDSRIREVIYPHVNPRDVFQEELQHLQSDINALNDKKKELEVCLEEESHEVKRLAARNSQLEITLYKEQEDCKRLGSKIKKLIKVHLRFIRAKEEVKRTQTRLKTLVDEFPLAETSRPANHGRESDVDVVSDGEPNHASQTWLESDRNHVSAGIEREDFELAVITRDDHESIQRRVLSSHDSRTAMFTQQHGINHEEIKISSEAGLSVNLIPMAQVLNDKEGNLVTNKSEDEPSRGKSVRDRSLSPISVPAEKVKGWNSGLSLPYTGIASHAEDENVEDFDVDDKEEVTNALHLQKWNLSMSGSLPSNGESLNTGNIFLRNLSTLTSVFDNHYNEYKGKDEEVDVEGFAPDDQVINLNV